jgi:hypothetical protein
MATSTSDLLNGSVYALFLSPVLTAPARRRTEVTAGRPLVKNFQLGRVHHYRYSVMHVILFF